VAKPRQRDVVAEATGPGGALDAATLMGLIGGMGTTQGAPAPSPAPSYEDWEQKMYDEGWLEWGPGDWIQEPEYRNRLRAAQEMSVEDEDEYLNISSMLRGRNKAAKELMEAIRLAAPMPLMNYLSEQEMRGRRAGQVRRGFTDKEGRTQLIINPLPKKQEQLWTPW
jgi:hypothetical protein